jgi:subtilisin family serine protease
MLQAGKNGIWKRLGRDLGLNSAIAVVVLLASAALTGCSGGALDQSGATQGNGGSNSVQESIVPDRFVVAYGPGGVPADVANRVTQAGGILREQFAALGMVVVECAPGTDASVMAQLQSDTSVAYVLHDRIVQAHRLRLMPMGMHPMAVPKLTAPESTAPTIVNSSGGDSYYSQTPQGWAVQQVGGYGGGIANGSGAPTHGAIHGPWDTTMGATIRIAVLDTGVDEAHPDIAPNLAVNLSEVNLAELPSACDDGTPWDQAGHGTWVASLAAAAAGPTTGKVIGVAPQASILNIKVMERIAAAGGDSPTAECEAGQGNRLLSWVIAGIEDAVNQHANVIVLSLGTLVDLDTGDGAGWQTVFNSVTYKAFSSGTLIVAAAGNDSFDLSGGRYIELPAQARDVLPVVASTNAACAEDLSSNAVCAAGAVTLPYYSNYGESLGAVAAPGGSYPEGTDTGVSGYVRGACSDGEPSTVDGLPGAGESFGCFGLGHQQYVQAIGTSASAPLVGGVAALIMAAHPSWSVTQVVSAMESTATAGSNFNYGQVNAAAVIQ